MGCRTRSPALRIERGEVLLTKLGHIAAGLLTLGLAAGGACATAPSSGRGGPVYLVRVEAVNGNPTAIRGPSAHPACVLQVGSRVVPVWLAHPADQDRPSPVVMEADARALKEGILIERSWREAVVHQVTDGELSAGAAVVYVPGPGKPTTVELAFELLPAPPPPPPGRSAPRVSLRPVAQTASTSLPNTLRDSSSR